MPADLTVFAWRHWLKKNRSRVGCGRSRTGRSSTPRRKQAKPQHQLWRRAYCQHAVRPKEKKSRRNSPRCEPHGGDWRCSASRSWLRRKNNSRIRLVIPSRKPLIQRPYVVDFRARLDWLVELIKDAGHEAT